MVFLLKLGTIYHNKSRKQVMSNGKNSVVIPGSGFAFIKKVNLDFYDVVIVSPRNHFLFTPLLPSTTAGTIEFRSIIEPIR